MATGCLRTCTHDWVLDALFVLEGLLRLFNPRAIHTVGQQSVFIGRSCRITHPKLRGAALPNGFHSVQGEYLCLSGKEEKRLGMGLNQEFSTGKKLDMEWNQVFSTHRHSCAYMNMQAKWWPGH